MKAGWIKKHCAFLDETEYSKGSDYGRFMKAFTSYKREGDNAHDDAPDGMTILAEFAEADVYKRQIIGSVEIVDCVQNHPSIWADKGVSHWVLTNPVLFEKPIENVRGKLGLWNYDWEETI